MTFCARKRNLCNASVGLQPWPHGQQFLTNWNLGLVGLSKFCKRQKGLKMSQEQVELSHARILWVYIYPRFLKHVFRLDYPKLSGLEKHLMCSVKKPPCMISPDMCIVQLQTMIYFPQPICKWLGDWMVVISSDKNVNRDGFMVMSWWWRNPEV